MSPCRITAAAILSLPLTAATAEELRDPTFKLNTYTSGLNEPVAMEFAPDGRLFVAELSGAVRVIIDGELSGQTIAKIDVYHENENGLLGLALDPDFAQNGYIYLFATIDTREQRILRVTEPARRTAADSGEPFVIKDNLPTRGVFHSGGGLKFGPDGMLYFTIGDNLIAENAQDMNTLSGKICRIDPNGGAPADNPFRTVNGAPRAIWALGFRNPFRICFAPDGRLFAMDVGSDGEGRREEINLVQKGGNYGWPEVEGRQSGAGNSGYIDPIYDYHEGGAAPVGAVYYSGKSFAPQYRGNLFHLEYVLGRLYRAVLDGDRVQTDLTVIDKANGPVDLAQGPDGALYYCEHFTGDIKRLSSVVDWSAEAQDAGETTVAGEQVVSNLPMSAMCGGNWLIGFAGSLAGLLAMRTPRRW